jgi:hypothetical protein
VIVVDKVKGCEYRVLVWYGVCTTHGDTTNRGNGVPRSKGV